LVDLGTSAAMPADPPQGLPFSPPLLVHLRRRLDEIALDVGAAVARVARSGEDSVQDMAELVQQRFQLGVIEALGVEVRDQDADRRAPGDEARAAHPESRGVAVLALARKQIEVDAAE